MNDLYVYTHARPYGAVFYVGKGSGRRAWDLAPTRRKRWHMNIVLKHGRENIVIKTIPVGTEQLAFELERLLIAEYRASGARLANLTDGGEGCAGRRMSAKQVAALASGRFKGKRASEAQRAALVKARPKIIAWQQSPAGQLHQKSFWKRSADARRAKALRQLICYHCGTPFTAKNLNARYCGDICNQRYWRAVRAGLVPEEAAVSL